LTFSTKPSVTRYLGYSVAIDGDTIVAGAVAAADGGAVYVFVRPSSGWVDASPTAQLTPSDQTGENSFGASVSISGDTIAVGEAAGFGRRGGELGFGQR